jgi:outer membrane immunogenic protein
MLRTITVSAAAALVSTVAMAADQLYYTPEPTPAPEAAYFYDWSGTHVGFHGGGAWGDGGSDFTIGGVGGSTSFDIDGGQVGVQAGHNWQHGNIVLGVGTDISWFEVDGAGGAATGATHSLDTGLLVNLTGRAGIAFDHVQPYLVGGLSVLDYDYSLSNLAGTATETHGDTDLGATLGGGLEVAVTNDVSLFGEYRHYWFEGESLAFAGPGGVAAQTVNPDLDIDTVTGGINWRF